MKLSYKLEKARQHFFADTKIGWFIAIHCGKYWERHKKSKFATVLMQATLPF